MERNSRIRKDTRKSPQKHDFRTEADTTTDAETQVNATGRVNVEETEKDVGLGLPRHLSAFHFRMTNHDTCARIVGYYWNFKARVSR